MVKGEFMLDNNELRYKKSLIFSVKLAKSRTSKGWSISRDSIMPLIPKLPYETECDIIAGDVRAKARLNIEPRIFYKSSQKELINFLDDLIEEGTSERIEIEMLLNKEDVNPIISVDKINELLTIIEDLTDENNRLISELEDYKNKNKLINNHLKELSDMLNGD